MECQNALGALDGKHIAMKKPKRSGSEYYNYTGFFPFADSPGQCRIHLFVCRWSSKSSSVAQIFNCSKLRKKIKDGTLGLPLPESLGEAGPDLHYFLIGDDTFAIMSTAEVNSQLKRE